MKSIRMKFFRWTTYRIRFWNWKSAELKRYSGWGCLDWWLVSLITRIVQRFWRITNKYQKKFTPKITMTFSMVTICKGNKWTLYWQWTFPVWYLPLDGCDNTMMIYLVKVFPLEIMYIVKFSSPQLWYRDLQIQMESSISCRKVFGRLRSLSTRWSSYIIPAIYYFVLPKKLVVTFSNKAVEKTMHPPNVKSTVLDSIVKVVLKNVSFNSPQYWNIYCECHITLDLPQEQESGLLSVC